MFKDVSRLKLADHEEKKIRGIVLHSIHGLVFFILMSAMLQFGWDDDSQERNFFTR